MTVTEMSQEALSRARNGSSLANNAAVVRGFMARGLEAVDILPRENVLTYWAWKAVGRQVCKGEHGIKVTTWIPVNKRDKNTGERKAVDALRSLTTWLAVRCRHARDNLLAEGPRERSGAT
ncbi:hypothetical protein LCGC14_2960850, partial [marine sediment metagenome]